MKPFDAADPKNMDQETLEALASEGWAEFVTVRGVAIYGGFLFLSFSATTLIVGDSYGRDDLALNFGLAVICGVLFGAYLRHEIVHELKRRG